MDQLSFSFAVEATALWSFAWKTAGESHLQILLDKALFDANHRAAADRERFGNLSIGCLWSTLALIAHQQDSGNQIMLGWRLTRMHHRLQPSALLLVQSHWIGGVKHTQCLHSFDAVLFSSHAGRGKKEHALSLEKRSKMVRSGGCSSR